MTQYIRFKHAGAGCSQIDYSKVSMYSILYNDEACGYLLLAYFYGSNAVVLESGTFDECHALLNKINIATDNVILDL